MNIPQNFMTLGTGYDGFTKAQKHSTFVATNPKQCGENFLHFSQFFIISLLNAFSTNFYFCSTNYFPVLTSSRFSIAEYSVIISLTLCLFGNKKSPYSPKRFLGWAINNLLIIMYFRGGYLTPAFCKQRQSLLNVFHTDRPTK